MKKVKVLKNFRFWIKPNSVFVDYNEGDTVDALEAHVTAGVEAGAFEVLNDGEKKGEVGHDQGAKDTRSKSDTGGSKG